MEEHFCSGHEHEGTWIWECINPGCGFAMLIQTDNHGVADSFKIVERGSAGPNVRHSGGYGGFGFEIDVSADL